MNLTFTPTGCPRAGFYADLGHRFTEPLKAFLNNAYKNNIDISECNIIFDDSKIWNKYKPSDNPAISIYNELFKQNLEISLPLPITQLCRDHWTYVPKTTFDQWNCLLQRFFQMSDSQNVLYNQMIKKYEFKESNVVGVYYRGTDKKTEREHSDVNKVIEGVEKILTESSDLKVLIQTDQKQILDIFLQKFKDKCFYLKELPHTESDRALHYTPEINKFELAKYMEISARMLSVCKYLVLTYSNVATCIGAYRNNSNNVLQY